MSPTLLEAAIALLLVWIGWRIGALVSPWILRRFKGRPGKRNDKTKPPKTIDI